MYESIIITAGRIGDAQLISTIYEAAIKKNGCTVSLRDALLHAFRVCDAHQKVISFTYQLFSENVEITSCQFEDILRTLICHVEYDSLCEHIIGKMKEQKKTISLPVLSILLNYVDVRSPKLTTAFINQTRYNKQNSSLLNLILSRELMRFSENQFPEGMMCIYKEMSAGGLTPSQSEISRLKRSVAVLMKNGYIFDIPKEDDLFTEIWSQNWLEMNIPTMSSIDNFMNIIKQSKRNQTVQLFELFKFV